MSFTTSLATFCSSVATSTSTQPKKNDCFVKILSVFQSSQPTFRGPRVNVIVRGRREQIPQKLDVARIQEDEGAVKNFPNRPQECVLIFLGVLYTSLRHAIVLVLFLHSLVGPQKSWSSSGPWETKQQQQTLAPRQRMRPAKRTPFSTDCTRRRN